MDDAVRDDEMESENTSKILIKPTDKHAENQGTVQAHTPAKQQKDIASNTPENPPAANPTPCMRFVPSSEYGTVCVCLCVCVCVCVCV
jgi:hypothetical protein